MLKVVSNTTPIISLLKIGKLNIFKDLYGEIFIPQEVFNEIEAGKNKEFYTDLSKIDWIKIEKINNEKSLCYFFFFCCAGRCYAASWIRACCAGGTPPCRPCARG